MFVGRPVWTPLCLGFWHHFTKQVSRVAHCRATSDSWITSRASVTTSSQSTSAQTTLVRSLRTLEFLTLSGPELGESCTEWSRGRFLFPSTKKETNIISTFILLTSLIHSTLTLCNCFYFNTVPVPLTLCHLLLLWVSPCIISLYRSSPTCSRNNGCQPSETNAACK